jgi:hypothetical protein
MGLDKPKKNEAPDLSRRRFLQISGAALGVAAVGGADAVFNAPQRSSGPEAITSEGKLATTLADRSLEVISELFKLEVEGAENLREIPPGKHILFLTTHLSDIDMPIAIAGLAKENVRNLKLAELSTHFDFLKNPTAYLGRLAGGANSLPVSHTLNFRGEHTVFNPEDFPPMKDVMLAGDHMVMAAYFNLKKTYKEKKWELPEKGGNGGVYLAQITPDTVIVPVAVDIQTPEPIAMGGPNPAELIKYHNAPARVRIGKPLEPHPISGVEKFAGLLEKFKKNTRLTDEERNEFTRIHRALREESDRVMHSLSDMLPEEKRAPERPRDTG